MESSSPTTPIADALQGHIQSTSAVLAALIVRLEAAGILTLTGFAKDLIAMSEAPEIEKAASRMLRDLAVDLMAAKSP